MEYLRWILLAAGIFFILFIYLLGRNRRRRKSYRPLDNQEELPEFSAQDWDDLDEGVGRVRIIARDPDSEYDDTLATHADHDELTSPAYEYRRSETADANDDADTAMLESAQPTSPAANPEASDDTQTQRQHKDAVPDIIVLYILARSGQKFAGDKINSAAKATGLVFGNMNIYHRLDDYDQAVFSMANMVEPGSFDPATLHEMRTPGLTLFMQVSEVVEAEAAFNDMLQCAYRMSEMLDGQLCNRRRQALTQNDAEQYRELVAGVDA